MSEPKAKRTREEIKARRRLEGTVGRTLPANMHCSFCRASLQHQVEKLIAGPWIFVCNECVRLCQGILDGAPPPNPGASFKPLDRPTEQLLSLGGLVVNYADDGARLPAADCRHPARPRGELGRHRRASGRFAPVGLGALLLRS